MYHPAVDGRYQPVAFGRGNEFGGRDLSVLVDQAEDQLRHLRAVLDRERHDGLREQAEAFLVEGLVDAVDPLHLARALGERGVVGFVFVEPVAAAFLGGIAGGVGGDHQRGQVAAVGSDGHQADRGRGLEGTILPAETHAGDILTDRLRDAPRLGQRAALAEPAALVALAAGAPDAFWRFPLQERADLLEQLVAGVVPACVVHHLALVAVALAQGMPGALFARRLQCAQALSNSRRLSNAVNGS